MPESISSPTPSRLGRYEILDEIGRGAMGVVYMARDPLIGRLVALKTFRMTSALAGQELETFRARFIREAQSAGILSHPNVVTIHDVVEESEEGATFIAMEYVRGTDLKERLVAEGRLHLAEAVHVVTEVAEGLDYAHSKGVVHRDVKPANILLTEDGEVKLTDFGIARVDTSSLTLEGQLLGTPNYMSPEQIKGEPTDHRADVFSLAVVLYEMLTGEKPFKGENVTMVTHRIVYDELAAPEELLGNLLPDSVMAVLGRALAKDPDERFAGVREMAQALQEAAAEVRAQERLNETQVIPELEEPSEAAEASASRRAGGGLAAAAGLPRRMGEAVRGSTRRFTQVLGRGLSRGWTRSRTALSGALGPGARSVGRSALGSVRRGLGRAAPSDSAAPSLSRLALVAAITAVTASLLGGLLLFAAGQDGAAGGAGVTEPTAEHRQRLEAAPLLRDAHFRLTEGDPLAALELLRRAERAAPDLPSVRARRRQVEAQARSLSLLEERVDRVAQGLEEARAAAEERRWEEAREAARRVQALEPDNREAAELAGRAEEALDRIARRREAEVRAARQAERRAAEAQDEGRMTGAVPGDVAETGGTEDGGEAAAAPTGEATLQLHFYSELPEGVLTLYFAGEQLVREPYRFYRRGGLFRSEPVDGTVENRYTVEAGTATVRVLVALPGRPAVSRVLEGNFPDGATRRLNVRIHEDLTLTARLE